MFRASLIFSAFLFFSITSLAEKSSKHPQMAPPGAAAKDKNAPGDDLDMSEPPFWMSSYEEFHDLQQFQKELYLEKLQPFLSEIPGLDPVSKKELLDASDWYQDWNRIRKKVYMACQDKEMLKTCEEIADVRIQALDLLSNQKEENRRANDLTKEAKESKDKKKKSK